MTAELLAVAADTGIIETWKSCEYEEDRYRIGPEAIEERLMHAIVRGQER
jgi:hypothetical protein